ncbi:DNA (cytosine-5)-methyltransferase 1 [Frigoribacterium sp. PhB107]|uniref:DNA cytosine methyltransferase n=1 Tax=Frigoribacterium sp. PhB107 TaxID=2485172 RepID=UPI000F497C88|nr:DNA cytosine methyltransferase [Frigoribacterium sp. PhB107]ROP77401.1 DNA (cytosine-5)-methyltransferase 1 [Frigoribacterium sp. PhB107]
MKHEEAPVTTTTLDLFAGAGGLSLGFEHANLGFRPTFAVEIEKAAAATFRRHFDCDVETGSIEDVGVFPQADVIIGGPPCQGFSPLGKRGTPDSRAKLNVLWEEYLRAVRQVKPAVFVIENVPEFQKSAQFLELLHEMETDPVLKEYSFAYGPLNAADYGAPQRRIRGIFMAVRGAETVEWPPPRTHGPKAETGVPYVTVRDAIADLPMYPEKSEPEISQSVHGERQDLHLKRNPRQSSLERYMAIPEGGNRFDLARNRPDLLPRCWAEKPTGTTDVMGRLWWERPSPTIRTEFFKPEKGRYLHPEAHRPITHREAARLQGFPDSFIFTGTKIEIARQIGNAVPVQLAAAIARHVQYALAHVTRNHEQLAS